MAIYVVCINVCFRCAFKPSNLVKYVCTYACVNSLIELFGRAKASTPADYGQKDTANSSFRFFFLLFKKPILLFVPFTAKKGTEVDIPTLYEWIDRPMYCTAELYANTTTTTAVEHFTPNQNDSIEMCKFICQERFPFNIRERTRRRICIVSTFLKSYSLSQTHHETREKLCVCFSCCY